MQRVSASMATLPETCCGHSTRLRRATVCRPTCGVGCAESDQLSHQVVQRLPTMADVGKKSTNGSAEATMTAVVAETGPDIGVPWHYGDPMREQRLLDGGAGVVDLSHRGVISVAGPDRLTWLHSL